MRFSDISVRTVLIGLAVAAGVFIGIRYVFGQIWDPAIRNAIVLAGAPLGALAGGYYVARQPVYRMLVHAILVIALDVLVLIVLRLLPVNPLLLGAMLLAGLLGVFLAQRAPISAAGTPFTPRRGYAQRRYPSARPVMRLPDWAWRMLSPIRSAMRNRQAGQLYDQLLRRTRMDRDLADRLIEFERRRNPYSSRAALIRDALDRLDRDNR